MDKRIKTKLVADARKLREHRSYVPLPALPEVLTLVGACAPFAHLKIQMQMSQTRSIRQQHCGSSARTLYIGLETCLETYMHFCATKADAASIASLPDENEAAAGFHVVNSALSR